MVNNTDNVPNMANKVSSTASRSVRIVSILDYSGSISVGNIVTFNREFCQSLSQSWVENDISGFASGSYRSFADFSIDDVALVSMADGLLIHINILSNYFALNCSLKKADLLM